MATNYNKWADFEKELEPDPEDLARERLKQQKDNMSEKEVRRLHDCWVEPDFRRMFEEYQEEVTDPKHRAETEEYLAQCEAEQRAGRQQVRPPAPLAAPPLEAEPPPRARRSPATSRSSSWDRVAPIRWRAARRRPFCASVAVRELNLCRVRSRSPQ